MRALVTGATGFLGSALTRRLVNNGDEIAVIVRAQSDMRRLKDILPRLTICIGDLCALESIANPIHKLGPEYIFHLAWHGVGNQLRNDYSQIEQNLSSTVNITRLAGEVGCRKLIALGSQAEYGPHPMQITEDTLTQPTTLYGATKLAAYHLTRTLLQSTTTAFVWLRLFSCYGPGDNSNWMIPYLIRTLLKGERPSLTKGEQIWDYLYVEDTVAAIYGAALADAACGVFNLGSGETQLLRTTVELIRDEIDPALSLGFGEVPYRPDQVMYLHADIDRLQNATGWHPVTPLREGIRRTIAWIRKQEQL